MEGTCVCTGSLSQEQKFSKVNKKKNKHILHKKKVNQLKAKKQALNRAGNRRGIAMHTNVLFMYRYICMFVCVLVDCLFFES